MRSIVVKHGAVELEDERISLSESNVQTSSHSQEPQFRPSEARRIFNAIPSQKRPLEDNDDVIIVEEDTPPVSHDAKPYVFPTLDEKEIEYLQIAASDEQTATSEESGMFAGETFQEPFDTQAPIKPEMKSLYEDIVSKSIAEASRILEEAHAKAQAEYHQLVEKSKEEIQQAKDEGFKQGVAEGTRSQMTNIRACIEQLEHTVARIEGKQEEYFASCEQDVKWLALEIAQKVLNKRVTEDELALYPLVTAAVAKQKNAKWLTVEISDSAPQLLQQLKDELEKGDEGKGITINSIKAPAGTCRMQTAEGFVDASIYRQLDNLREYFSQQPQ